MVENKVNSGRVSELEKLLKTEHGKQRYAEFLMAISARASTRSAAAMIGVHPSTLTRWVERGKVETDGCYRRLYDDVVIAIGQATMSAEVELYAQKPEFYLSRGMGRHLLGDTHNHRPDSLSNTYELDGTVTDHSNDVPTIADDTPNDHNISDALTLDALAVLRNNGIDINTLIDRHVENQGRAIESSLQNDDHHKTQHVDHNR
jgi:hypothetical protein